MYSFTIKDLENLSGIKAHTIRIWEQRYSFLKPGRSETNIRYYGNRELKQLLNIALLNKFGYKISHIDKMNEKEIIEKVMSLNQMEAQQERIVNSLIDNMVEFNTSKFEKLLNDYILSRGIEKTILQIIFPYFEKIGILWLTNHINPAHEHMVSNIIRQKLVVGIDQVYSSVEINKTFLLFLPESEFHEMGLLFMHFLLKSRGISVIYLGCSIPLDDVAYVVQVKKPDYIYSHITAPGNKFNFEKFISQLGTKFQGIPVILSGQLTKSYQKKIHAPVSFKKSLSEVMEFVSAL